jgi:hypothetical protein
VATNNGWQRIVAAAVMAVAPLAVTLALGTATAHADTYVERGGGGGSVQHRPGWENGPDLGAAPRPCASAALVEQRRAGPMAGHLRQLPLTLRATALAVASSGCATAVGTTRRPALDRTACDGCWV